MELRLGEQDQRHADQDKTIRENKQRFEEQDKRLRAQERTISNYKQRLEEHENKLAVQERAISDYKHMFEVHDKKLANQDREISVFRHRLEKQDRKLAVHEWKINDYKQKIEKQDKTLAIQERTIGDYKQKVATLELTVTELKIRQRNGVADDSDQVDADNYRNHIVENTSGNGITRKESERKWRALLDAESPVAFHAVIKVVGEVNHLGINQKIVFPDVIENIGGAYQNQHGIFTAPRPGIYIFSTSIMSDKTGHVEIVVSLMKNGQVLSRAFAHGDSGRHDQGSVTVVTQLVTGDQVWVSNSYHTDTSLWGEYYDTFMGCLVWPL